MGGTCRCANQVALRVELLRLTDRSGRLDPSNGRKSVDLSVEGRDRLNSGRFGARDEVGLREVESFDLIDLERAEQQRFVGDDNGWKPDDRAHELRDAFRSTS